MSGRRKRGTLQQRWEDCIGRYISKEDDKLREKEREGSWVEQLYPFRAAGNNIFNNLYQTSVPVTRAVFITTLDTQ